MSKFSELSAKIQAEGKSKASADAITAAIGRKKYGKKKFQEMSAKGRKKKRKYTSTEKNVYAAMKGKGK